MKNLQVVTPQALEELIPSYAFADVPLFIAGAPGVGKTEIISGAASAYLRHVADAGGAVTASGALRIDVSQFDDPARLVTATHLALTDPIEMKGIGMVEAGMTVFTRPEVMPTEGDGTIFLFVDELTSADKLQQTLGMQLVHERRIGQHLLPDYVRVFGAGNRLADRSTAGRMATALANRFAHLTLEPSADESRQWGARTGRYKEEIISYLGMFPADILAFDPTNDDAAFASPRSWEMLSRHMAAGYPAQRAATLVASYVGNTTAARFMAHLAVWQRLPNLDLLLQDPDGAPVPDATDPGLSFAIASALAYRAKATNYTAISRYMRRMRQEYRAMHVSIACSRAPEIKAATGFTQLAATLGADA